MHRDRRLLYAPWVPTVLTWYKSVNISFWVKAASWNDITAAYWVYAGSALMLTIFAALTVLGIRFAWKKNRQAFTLLCLLAFLPVLVPGAMSVLTHPSFAPRYGMVGCKPAFSPLVAQRGARVVAAIASLASSPYRRSPRSSWIATIDGSCRRQSPKRPGGKRNRRIS